MKVHKHLVLLYYLVLCEILNGSSLIAAKLLRVNVFHFAATNENALV